MTERLAGKVALVTGAARGIGRAQALTLARHGADIIAIDVVDQIPTVPYPMSRPEDLEVTAKEIAALDRRSVVVQGDVRSAIEIEAAVSQGIEELGQIDIVIANAGIYSLGPFWELSEKEWSDVLETNLTGVWRTIKAVAPHMISRETGAIVMIASVNGIEPAIGYAHYVAAKHGLIGLMECVALELAPFGIRCNALCPGVTDTGIVSWQGAYDQYAGHPGGTREDLVAAARQFHALKGAGLLDPQNVANAALWLVSDESAMITGTTIPVDAGHVLLPGVNHNPVL